MLKQHDPMEDCKDHCYVCGLDEPGFGYIRCFECNHLYETRQDLRRAFRRELIRGARFDSNQLGLRAPFWRSTPFGPSTVRMWWMLLTARASKIRFCQHCGHDF